jgi:hypothetical protein
MTHFRAIALFALLFLLVLPLGQTRAGTGPIESQPAEALLIRFSHWGGQCPRLCVEWFDGCNYCTCGRGRIDVCTQRRCFWRGRARCLRYGF